MKHLTPPLTKSEIEQRDKRVMTLVGRIIVAIPFLLIIAGFLIARYGA